MPGPGKYERTPEIRAKNADAARNRSAETRAKLAQAAKRRDPASRRRSPETRAKMAEAARQAWTPERREASKLKPGDVHFNVGRKATPEQKENMRLARLASPNMRGWKLTDEQRSNISTAHKGRTHLLKRYGISPERYAEEIAKGNAWCHHGRHFVAADQINRSGCCPLCAADYYRIQDLKRKFGTDPEWYEKTLAEQGGVCAICAVHKPRAGARNLAIDHNHKTGAIRGLLCNSCNRALERVEMIPAWPLKALAYLARFN